MSEKKKAGRKPINDGLSNRERYMQDRNPHSFNLTKAEEDLLKLAKENNPSIKVSDIFMRGVLELLRERQSKNIA